MIVCSSSFSKWFHWLKLEDQRPSCMATEIQHLSNLYYGTWASLWYPKSYITLDTDWKISKCCFLNHSSLSHQICLIASPVTCNSRKQSYACSCPLSFEKFWGICFGPQPNDRRKNRTLSMKFFTTGCKKYALSSSVLSQCQGRKAVFSTSSSPWWRASSHTTPLEFNFTRVFMSSYCDLFGNVFTQKCQLLYNKISISWAARTILYELH